jgi:hypothetical protein
MEHPGAYIFSQENSRKNSRILTCGFAGSLFIARARVCGAECNSIKQLEICCRH